tara:strand:- start:161 stop:409 length:249 start_codon:yes stop_codon:yes gene_type:complete
MKVFLVGLMFLLTACSMVVGDTCDPEELAPYSKDYSKELLQGCSKKCCVWTVINFETTQSCDEMWCFKDCSWDMMHQTCYDF